VCLRKHHLESIGRAFGLWLEKRNFRVFDFYGLWEKFKKINLGNGTFVLQAMANQMYVWVTPLF
jgi:hypothetical protein